MGSLRSLWFLGSLLQWLMGKPARIIPIGLHTCGTRTKQSAFASFWRSRHATGIKRKQVTNFRHAGWTEDEIRQAGEECVEALASETIRAKKDEIDAFMARYVQQQEG